MDDFLKKVVEGIGVSPSDVCLQCFNENFEGAVNIEWFKKEDHFEVIFYKNNLEHIAIFSLSGILLEYRLNLPDNYLPEPINKIIQSKGELMSSVMRNKGNTIEYEVIVRDSEMKRHLITLSDIGVIVEEKGL